MDPSGDVTLVVEGINLKCDKRILVENSHYFKAMFEGNFMERDMDIITMDGVDIQSLKVCLLMLENRELVPRDEEDLALVLQTACMLQFEEIPEIVRDKLLEEVNVTNCLKVWFLLETLNLGSVKAKKMALVEFNTLKDQDDLLDLTKEQLYQYLSNVYLVCEEMEVFRTFMNWHRVNGNNVMDVLACLDFNRLSNEDIENMMSDIHASESLVNVLECIIALKKGEHVKNLQLSLNLAHKVLDGNRRGSWMKPRFFEEVESEVEGIEVEENEVAEEDVDFWKVLKCWMCFYENHYKCILTGNKKLITLTSDTVIYDKLILFTWNYDCVQKHWGRKFDMESYFSGISIYHSNMRSCKYKNQRFMLEYNKKRAYIYKPDRSQFYLLRADQTNFPDIGECTLHPLNDRILVEDSSQLVELRIVEDYLYVEKVSALLPDNSQVNDKSVLCHHPEYTVSKNNNLVTLESDMIFLDQGIYRTGTLKYVYDTSCEMLWPDDHDLSGRDKYVNTIENLFGESSNRC